MARLWNASDTTSCCEILANQQSSFRHRFGGEPSHSGIVPARGQAPIHLVVTFDLADERVPFAQPGVVELPLFYPFQYDGSSMSYRVLNDSAIEIVEPPNRKFTPSFPFDGYPQIFPPLPFSLANPIAIDELFHDDFLRERWQEELKDAAKHQRTPDDVDRIAIVECLMQGPPRSTCPNPACNQQSLKLLTVLRGDVLPGFHFWSNDEFGPEVDVTFEYCPQCFLIHTENQCS